MDKFNWQASESAPENYPMQIISGRFSFPDGGSLYIPDQKRIYHGWGIGHSSHIVGADRKSLPNAVAITFFSYTENVFYSGHFELPYAQILSLFNEGYVSPRNGEHITYDQMVAGVAPGGAVSVWVSGLDKTTAIFLGQAEKKDVDWTVIIDNPDISRNDFVKKVIKGALKTPEAIGALKKNGIPFGLWEGYHRKRYHWQPLFTNIVVRDDLIYTLKYFNGEEDYLYVPLDAALAKQDRAVPSELYFVWKRPEKENLVYKIFFDEKEIFGLFEKLGGKGQPLWLEMKMFDTEKGKQFAVLLRNEEEGAYFKQVQLKTYTALR